MKHALLGNVHTPKEFASFLHVTPGTITGWIRKNKLKAFRIVGRYYVPASELARVKNEAMNIKQTVGYLDFWQNMGATPTGGGR
jgi:hypothetical protein